MEDLVLAITWIKTGIRSLPELLGMAFPIRKKP